MINRSVAIGIGILVIVGLGFLFISNMTGNVITGLSTSSKVVEDKYFRISNFGDSDNGSLEDDSSESGMGNG